MNEILISSFLQGVLAFFAPCAVALLPGYLAHFLQKNTTEKNKFRKTTLYALSTVAGITLIYLIASILFYTVSSLLKSILPYIVITLGFVLIVFGIMMVFNKTISFSFHAQAKSKSSYVEAFLFGITYGLGALGCLFPLFILLLTQALTHSAGYLFFIAYGLGMASLMFAFYFLAILAKTFVQKSLMKILPYITRIGGVVIILGGAYIIWYQSGLLF